MGCYTHSSWKQLLHLEHICLRFATKTLSCFVLLLPRRVTA